MKRTLAGFALLPALAATGASGQDLRDFAVTPNEFATAATLEEFYANATFCECDLSQAVRYLQTAPPEEARRGLDVLGGQDLAGALGPRQALSNQLTQRLAWQLRPAGPEPPRDVIDFVDSPAGGGPAGDPCAAACTPRRSYLTPPRPVTWLQGIGGVTDSDQGPGDYDANIGGVLFGGHVPVSDAASLGLAASYGRLDSDSQFTGVEIDSWRMLGYGRYAGETLYAFGGAGYGFDDYATRRQLLFGPFDRTATGDAGGNEAFVFGETGLTLPVSGGLALQPFVGLAANQLSRDGFNERSDSQLGLRVSGADASSFATYLGGRAVAQHYVSPSCLVRPEVRAAWWHDYLADGGETTVAFARDPSLPFTVASAAPGKDAAVLGLGATLVAWKEYSFGAQYDAALAADATSHAVAVTALCAW